MKSSALRWIAMAAAVTAAALAAETPTDTFQKAPARPVDLTHDKNLYVVGYAHLDTQWRWTYPQVAREFIANTLKDNFALLDKYPNYIFNFTGSRRYEMMQEYYPEDFAKLKQYVAQGRWFPAGSSVDEGDSMVPSAESLIRHTLYGNHYFRREFGIASDEFMLPDCFGFPYALPTILAHDGIKGFSTQKLTWGSAIGIPFKVGVWQGPDGSSVVAALDPGAYTGRVTEDLSHNESWLKRINDTGAMSGAYVDYHYYGTGDRGGAPVDESVAWIERSIAGKGPIRVISSRSDEMFNDLKPDQIAKLPHYQGELLLTQHSSGSISSEAYMKRWNRKNELLADAAERASVAALWLGADPYPTRKLYDAWDLLLGSQMHDMLPGTSLPLAYQYCWNDELLAANQFSAVLQGAVGGVASALDTRAQGVPVVVYNALSIARTDVVQATVTFPGAAPVAVRVIAPNGRELPAQVLGRDGNKLTIAFAARMDAVAFATFDVRPADRAPAAGSELHVSPTGLENAHYRVTLAPNGDVASIYDKLAGRELLAKPAQLEFQAEKPEQYPAWNMDWADQQKPPRGYVEGPAKVRVVESGPVRVALEVEREAEGSRFIQTIRLAAGAAGDRVDFATNIDWQTPGCALKAAFPLTVSNPVATYDTQVGTVDRGNNNPKKYEVPQHEWFNIDTPDQSFGVAVLNDCKYGSDKPDDSTLRLTLLYTPGVRMAFQDQASQDFGRHDILYAVTSHRGDWRSAEVPWAGARVNEPLIAFQASTHAGALGRELSLFKVSSNQVLLEAVKKAEDSDEIIVRFQELTGKPAAAVRLSAAGGIVAAREVDGQERPLGGATLKGHDLVFDVRGYGLRAFALKLGAPGARASAPVSQPVALRYDEDVVSSNGNRADGRFDAAGETYPAEQFPAKLTSEGVDFTLGATTDGAKNAVAARGQTIALPAGNFDHVYLLAAADGDTTGRFAVDGRPVDLTIESWAGFVGQWDNRLWQGEVPELTYVWYNPLGGLEPGYVKSGSVAWYSQHRHAASGDEYYQYGYIFKYGMPIPAGARTLTLPDNPRIRIFAVTVAGSTHDGVVAAAPLFDQLRDHAADAPVFATAPGTFRDTTAVSIRHPLYWRDGGLHYTLDGSTPTAASPTYTGPVELNRDTVVTACECDGAGHAGPIARATYHINDTTPPRVTSAFAPATEPALRVAFSEPVDRSSAQDAKNYEVAGAQVTAAKLTADGQSVVLTLSAPLQATAQLSVHGIRDTSTAANQLERQDIAIDVAKPVFEHAMLAAGDQAKIQDPALPVKKGQPWTMNVFVHPTGPIDNRTLIAGFGRADDAGGAVGRYFAKFANGVHLWVHGRTELESFTPLTTDGWQMLTATYDGDMLRLFVDGREVSSVEVALGQDQPVVQLAPLDPWDKERRFQGELRDFAIWDRVLPDAGIQALYAGGHKE